jgi:hypothetical protein
LNDILVDLLEPNAFVVSQSQLDLVKASRLEPDEIDSEGHQSNDWNGRLLANTLSHG